MYPGMYFGSKDFTSYWIFLKGYFSLLKSMANPHQQQCYQGVFNTINSYQQESIHQTRITSYNPLQIIKIPQKMSQKVGSQPLSTTTKTIFIRNRTIASVLILLANLGGFLHLLPVFPQLLINSSCCVYLGTIMSTKLKRSRDDTIVEEDKGKDRERIGQKEALRFPIVASAFLFGFYLIYKYVSQSLVNTLLTIQFSIATIISSSNLLEVSLPFPDQYRKVLKHVKPPKFLKSLLQIDDFDISVASIICTILVSVPVVLYCSTKYWALNNVFGVLFSIMALRNIDLASFKVGFLLLWFLFFYDIFWVYGTDVMVTVAKKLDIPIKLLFPYINNQGVEKFSMLGLGDIVIPGIFIALCLKLDIDRSIKKQIKKVSQFKLPYFTTSFIGYIVGICATFAAMYIFDHAQPALLFLVPTCTLSVLVLGAIKGDLKELEHYDTSPAATEEEKKKAEKSQEKTELIKSN